MITIITVVICQHSITTYNATNKVMIHQAMGGAQGQAEDIKAGGA